MLEALIGYEIYPVAAAFGYAWLLPAVAVLAYPAAALACGSAFLPTTQPCPRY